MARHAQGPAWDALLRAAGELTWRAGPLAKGPSICHGTAGSALACLKLWQRFGQAHWLERARLLALHAAQQVEARCPRAAELDRLDAIDARPIAFADHCYGCTAGAGSSCGGALAG